MTMRMKTLLAALSLFVVMGLSPVAGLAQQNTEEVPAEDAQSCQDYCVQAKDQCVGECAGDASCQDECTREFEECSASCNQPVAG